MSAIRNHRIGAGTIASAGGVVAYAVPAGYALILKNVQLFSTAAAAQGYSIQLNAQPENASVYVAADSVASNAIAAWNGWTVMNEGDTLAIFAATGNLHWWAAGALLPFAPGAAAQLLPAPLPGTPVAGTSLPLPSAPPW